MKVLTIIPADDSQPITTRTSAAHLDELQQIVGGLIQSIPHWVEHENRRAEVYCDEEGRLKGKQRNHRATAMWQKVLGDERPFSYPPQLYGDVVIVQTAPKIVPFERRVITLTLSGEEWFTVVAKLAGKPLSADGKELLHRAGVSISNQLAEEAAKR
jgi:hypothetical protein